MTLGEVLVLSFLAFNHRPICTERYPQGVVADGPSCPKNDLGNDSGLIEGVPCVRRFKA